CGGLGDDGGEREPAASARLPALQCHADDGAFGVEGEHTAFQAIAGAEVLGFAGLDDDVFAADADHDVVMGGGRSDGDQLDFADGQGGESFVNAGDAGGDDGFYAHHAGDLGVHRAGEDVGQGAALPDGALVGDHDVIAQGHGFDAVVGGDG